VALDSSYFDVPDEAANVTSFGRHGAAGGPAAYPQARCALLVECASHAVLDAHLGAHTSSESALAQPLLQRLKPQMLCLADRGFSNYPNWRQASSSGAQLLWRCKTNWQLPVDKMLADGSYLSTIYPNQASRKAGQGAMVVRVIEYALPQQEGAQERYRLITTLLNPARAGALELATLYRQRWHIESVLDELKTHMVQGRRTLRSKTPQGVKQEFYGWLLMHYATCWLMHHSASAHRVEQSRLSFKGTLELVRRQQPHSGAFPPR
jgi:Transposase DDE domain